MSALRRIALLAGAGVALSACDPSGVFIDPTGKTCAGFISPCPEGWSCVQALDSPNTICWPTGDAGEEEDGGLDSGIPDSGPPITDGGHDAGHDAGIPDSGIPDSGIPDSGVPDSGIPDAGGGCLIGGKSFPAGTVNSENSCQACVPATTTVTWTTLPTGTACATGMVCLGTNCVSSCFIGGAIVAKGTANPVTSCQTCQPAESTTAYSNVADGTQCGADGSNLCVSGVCSSVCLIDGGLLPAAQVNPADACEECEPSLSNTSWTVLANGASCGSGKICASGNCAADCDIAGAIIVGSTVNPANPCQICLPGTSTSGWSDLPNALSCGTDELCSGGQCVYGCDISGDAVDAGAVEVGNACNTCNPADSTTSWTVLANGTPCGSGICVSGSCADDCNIGGSYVPANTANPSNGCQGCFPSQDATNWSPEPNGASCGTGLVCSNGNCVSGCGVGGVAVDAGSSPAANPCVICNPASSTTSYSNLPTGTACGTGLTCNSGSCCGGTHGTILCNGTPIDTCVDDLNCGYCANACGYPNGCFAGQCQLAANMPTARDSLAAATGPDGKIYAIGGYEETTGNTLATVEIYDPRSNVWKNGPAMPTGVSYMGAVSNSTGILVMGGENSGFNPVAFGQFLTVASGAWAQTPSAPTGFTDNPPATGPSGVVYVPGGCDVVSGFCGYSGTTQVLKFTPSGSAGGGTWGFGPALPFAVDFAGVTAGLDGTLYTIGGSPDDTNPIGDVQTLDPSASAWSLIANLPTPRCTLSAATDNAGLIYAIAGDNCLEAANYTLYDNTEIYDPDAGTWTEGSPIPNEITMAGATLGPDGRIYVIGGYNGISDQNSVQVYDPATQSWIP